jgi:hypothetical protein
MLTPKRRTLLALLCITIFAKATPRPPNPYPNELQGFRFYAKYLAPLRPGISSKEAVRKDLGDTSAVKRDGWTIRQFYSTAGGPVSKPSLESLYDLELTPDAFIRFGAVKFPALFTHCHVGVSEMNITFDVYEDTSGLEYWLHPQDHHLVKIVYGLKRRPYPPGTFC